MKSFIRIDKFLWAVRLFKTRTLAAETCRSGKVTINDNPVKASREIKTGEIVKIRHGQFTKTIRIIGILENRVSAKLVVNFIEDLTPPEEYKKLEVNKEVSFVKRERGSGRPTKKERRDIDSYFPEW